MMEMVSEYRALRASVIRLWRDSGPSLDPNDLSDLTRFNESIDQSLTTAVNSYTRRVDQSREMFLAILGHDLRNPLNTVSVSADLLWALGGLDAEGREVVGHISAAAAVMGRMIGDLLDYTRTRLGAGMPTSPAGMDLADLCRAVLAEFRAGHAAPRAALDAGAGVTGEWDAARLRQVLSNLLANAIQHGRAGRARGIVAAVERPGRRAHRPQHRAADRAGRAGDDLRAAGARRAAGRPDAARDRQHRAGAVHRPRDRERPRRRDRTSRPPPPTAPPSPSASPANVPPPLFM